MIRCAPFDKIRLFVIIGWLVGVLSLTGGCRSEAGRCEAGNLPDSLFREGDLVFRRGQSMASRFVLLADQLSVYSHTGILVRDTTGWKVVHVVPGEREFEGNRDRIKMEPLDVFFDPKRAVKGAVMRVDDPRISQQAARRAVSLFQNGILFDHNYNLEDTTRMYCTELIRTVFLKEGIDLTGGKLSRINIPGFKGDYILPSDIQQSQLVSLIYHF